MRELILATGNQGKIQELTHLLAPIHCIPQHELNITDAEETGLSFVENAIIKARHASKIAEKPALADDSGLVVLSLRGEPGIYSSRYSGEHATDQSNIEKLLDKMKDIPDYERQAYFFCAVVLVEHALDPTPIIATGKLEGKIAFEPEGESGFGYDPIFYVPEYETTVAQLSAELKNQFSHRGQALKSLLNQMLGE